MLPLLLALAGCPAVPADTGPLLPKAFVWMSQDTAVVATDGAGLAFEFVNVGDSAVAIYKNCHYLGTVRNSIGDRDTFPDPEQPPIWRGEGIAIIFVTRRVLLEVGKVVELLGVIRE